MRFVCVSSQACPASTTDKVYGEGGESSEKVVIIGELSGMSPFSSGGLPANRAVLIHRSPLLLEGDGTWGRQVESKSARVSRLS